ncbi:MULTISPECIES: hypothetical protein [unclassified Wenzhouxiangella]|uniref:hypothetical protein n=1 Tax=unclassified Wenzhouxiangella TaxID=2613841 RepID=UPI0011C05C39|nr:MULTISPECIES: hypothetical protein [unclassified Wenzhouxiangella]
MVEMELWIEGEQRGTPMLVVEPGEPATVEVSDATGESGWKIELLVDPPIASEGAPVGSIWLNLAVQERREGEWELLTDSLLGVREGRTGTMTLVESGVDEATRENSLVHLTARASILRPSETTN